MWLYKYTTCTYTSVHVTWLSCDYHVTICDYHVTIMWLSRDYPVTIMWLSRDYHVTVTWLSCDYHVTAMWLSCDYHVTVMWLSCYCHVTVMWLSCDYHVTIMWLSCDFCSCFHRYETSYIHSEVCLHLYLFFVGRVYSMHALISVQFMTMLWRSPMIGTAIAILVRTVCTIAFRAALCKKYILHIATHH